MVVSLFIWLWVIGGVPAAILGETVQSETPRVARAGRIGFAFLLWVDLLIAAVALSKGAAAPTSPMTRNYWWFAVIAAGIPLAIVSGVAVRRGYTGRHRAVLAAATLVTAGLYVVFPLSFASATQHSLTGLARFAHDNHVLGVTILLIPALILLTDEFTRRGEVDADLAPEPPAWRARRRYLIGGGLFLVILVWMAGTTAAGMLLALGILLVAGSLFLWHKDRVGVRSARRDLSPPGD